MEMRLEIDGRYSNIKFSACHFIAGHARCGKLHGHVYVIQMILYGEKGENGMIMDFIDLKRALRRITEEFDHRVLLPKNSTRVILDERDDEVEARIDGKRYLFPREDVLILEISESSAEEMAEAMLNRIMDEIDFPSNVSRVEVGVDEERGQSAWVSRDLR
jgi:6-pyruvoyltetrahydropterin/6-carboxytetrahydropterin synthase